MRRRRRDDGPRPSPSRVQLITLTDVISCQSEEAKHAEYVLYIDADMLLRLPFDPFKLGVRKGVVLSEHVGYMDTGLKHGLPAQVTSVEQPDPSPVGAPSAAAAACI